MEQSCTRYREGDLSYISKNNKVGQRETAGLEKVKYYLLRTESLVKGKDMKQEELHNTKISENVGVWSFQKSEMSEFQSFWKTNKQINITYLGNSPEFRVVLEPWNGF